MFKGKLIFNRVILILLLLGIFLFVSGDKDFSAPQKVSAQSGVSDAIGVRVVSNPKHYSPLTWYYHQGFQGSPKRTRVDGYKAIQEGRSTYVTVGNVEGDTLNTYVYIISYDQGAERMTREIYGQIIDNWEFNQNIDNTGTCTISNLICSDSEDCPAGYICLQDKCQISGEKPSCHIDEDCPSGIYCDSQKAKIIRDVERMGEITDVQSALESYRARNGGYPILSSGTYLKYKTTSAWPSWQKELGAKLGTKMPLDPVNTFGVCSTTATFTPETCWDKANSRFARTIDGNGQPQLREGDNIYFYNTLSPQDYILCANLETDAEFSNLGSYGCQSSPSPLTNNPPTVQNPNLNGSAGGSFTGYLQITDPEGDNIILNTAIVPSTTISSGWSTNNGEDIYISQVSDNEFLVEADSAPTASGDYTFDMEIEDSYQNQTTQTITISIGSNPPQIDVSGCANNVDVTHSYTCTTTCLTSNCDQFQYSWDLGKPSSMTNNTDTGAISGTPQVSEAGDYEIIIRAKDVTSGLLSQAETLNLSIQNFCGDGVVQDPNMKGVNEECESAGNGTSEDDQYECLLACNEPDNSDCCQWTEGYCGDGEVQNGNNGTVDHGEECDPNLTDTSIMREVLVDGDPAMTESELIESYNISCDSSCELDPVLSQDNDDDGYINYLDCDDSAAGEDGIIGTMDDGDNINPGEPDDCTQYDGVDNNCNGVADENADTSQVLANNDFEIIDPGTNFPENWYERTQKHADVYPTIMESRSGDKSMLIETDPDQDYPGICNEYNCSDIGSRCEWRDIGSGDHLCVFEGQDEDPNNTYDPATNETRYSEGETLVWPFTHRVMWGSLNYDVSEVPFSVGDNIIIRFYYKGEVRFENSLRGIFSYTPGSASQSTRLSGSHMINLTNSYNDVNGTSLTTEEYCNNEFRGGNALVCADYTSRCCYHGDTPANQTEPYTAFYPPGIPDNTYPDWQVYSHMFTYTEDLDKLRDDYGDRHQRISLRWGYHDTTSGSNLYIDDFDLIKCVNLP